MAITPARERVLKSRERKRRGVIPDQVEVSTLEVDLLRRRGYGARPAPSWAIFERTCDGVTRSRNGSRYGVIKSSEKHALTAAAKATRSSRSFGSR